jgi:hypothetical protein
MISPAATSPGVESTRRPKSPTASLVDGALEIEVYDVLRLHEVFEDARGRFGDLAALPGVLGLSVVVRARDAVRGGSRAVEVEVVARTATHPISIRCVRQSAGAAIELAAIVLKLRLTSSDRPDSPGA